MTVPAPFLYSLSVFQKCHLPFLLWSLNPIIVLLPLKDAVILKLLPSRLSVLLPPSLALGVTKPRSVLLVAGPWVTFAMTLGGWGLQTALLSFSSWHLPPPVPEPSALGQCQRRVIAVSSAAPPLHSPQKGPVVNKQGTGLAARDEKKQEP